MSVPWLHSHLAALPVFVFATCGLWFVGDAFNSRSFAIAGALCGVVLGMMVMMPLYHYIVPLVKPDRR